MLFRIALAAPHALESLEAVAVLTPKLAGNAARLADHFGFVGSDRFHMFILLQGLAVMQGKGVLTECKCVDALLRKKYAHTTYR